jgi:quercetin dioxygenase-like cupin family protein
MTPRVGGDQPQIIDHDALVAATDHTGAIWSLASDQLNVNVVRFEAGQGVEAHVNSEVDVLGVVLSGQARLSIDDQPPHELRPGTLFFVPRGHARALQVIDGPLIYVSCHQRRAGLWPQTRRPT